MRPERAYYLYFALTGLGFALPATTLMPFLHDDIGLTLSQISLLNATFWTTTTLFEIPTGMFADGRGRAWSVRLGAIIFGLGLFFYYIAHSFGGVLLAEVTAALGSAFISGALQAWVADAMHQAGRGQELRKVFATGSMIRGAAVLSGGLVGAYIGLFINLRILLVFSAASFWLAALSSFVWMRAAGEPEVRLTEWQALKQATHVVRQKPALVWALAAAVIFGGVATYNIYWAVFFREEIGQVGLGWMWVLVYGALIIAGYLVRRSRIPAGGEGVGVVLALAVTGGGIAALGLFHPLLLLLAFAAIHEAGRGAFEPLLDSYTQHRVESSYRATFGSLQAFISRSGLALAMIFTWLFTEGTESSPELIRSVWVTGGSVMLVLTIFLAISHRQRLRHLVSHTNSEA